MSLTSQAPARDRLILANSTDEALAALASGARPFAGGTWLMRAPTRGEALQGDFVALSRINGLDRIKIGPDVATIGAAASLAAIAEAFAPEPEFAGLATGAGQAANPAVRRVATLGGNLCTTAFAAADLPPALLALQAEVWLQNKAGLILMPIADFLMRRDVLLVDHLLVEVQISRMPRHTGHARLPMRKAGDYPAAIVSVALAAGNATIAVGAVEAQVSRWPALEAALTALPDLTPVAAADAAKANLATFIPRDGIDAPGWYRVEVLPALVRRAIAAALNVEGRN